MISRRVLEPILVDARPGAGPFSGPTMPSAPHRRAQAARMGWPWRLAPVLAAMALAGAAIVAPVRAEQRFALPEFSNHPLPEMTAPPVRAVVWEYLDVAFLVAATALASYLAIHRRSRRGLLALSLVSLVWLGFWRGGCVCPIGAIQNVALALADPSYLVPWSVVAIFAAPLVFALFFGRTFCAAVCPLGTLQELVALRPAKVPGWLDHCLGLIPYVYLGFGAALASTGSLFLICDYDPLVGFLRLSGATNMLVLGLSLLVIGVFVGRPYCRYLCPYGALLGLAAKLSWRHLRIPPEECLKCRLCEDACPFGAIEPPTVPETSATRAAGRLRLAALVVLAPVLVAAGALVGRELEIPLSKLDATVRVAERVRQEETGQVEGTTDQSDAFRNTGRTTRELYLDARRRQERFATVGGWLGAWIGLVVGVKLIHLSIRRRRTEYLPDRARCVSCGRCFWYCPPEQARRGLISIVPDQPQTPGEA